MDISYGGAVVGHRSGPASILEVPEILDHCHCGISGSRSIREGSRVKLVRHVDRGAGGEDKKLNQNRVSWD